MPLNLRSITFFYAFWIPIIACETLLCALVILRAVRGWRRRENLLDSGKALVAVLIRDSIFYFLVCVPRRAARARADRPHRLFAVYLTNTIIFVGGNVSPSPARRAPR